MTMVHFVQPDCATCPFCHKYWKLVQSIDGLGKLLLSSSKLFFSLDFEVGESSTKKNFISASAEPEKYSILDETDP